MGLNPNIPLSVIPPKAPDFLGSMQDVMTVRGQQIQLQKAQEARADEEALKAAYQKYGMDPKNRPLIAQDVAQRNPLLAEKLTQTWQEQDLATRKDKQTLAEQGMKAWMTMLPFAEASALAMIDHPETHWKSGVQNLKLLAETFGKIGAPPEMLAPISKMGDVPDPASLEFVKQIPQWTQVIGKNMTMYQEAIRAAERDKGGPLTEPETIAVWRRVQEVTQQTSQRPIKVDYVDEKGVKRSRWVHPQDAVGLDVQAPPTGQQTPDQPQVVLEKPPVEEEENAVIPGGTYTAKAVWGAAETYILTGELKTNPRSADPKQRANHDAVINTAYARINNESTLPELRATYAALNMGQKQLMKQYLSTSAFVDSATKGIEQLASISASYPRSSVPVVNDIKLWWNRNLKQDPNLSELEVWVFNAARDYAKATSGSAGSVQQMTDAQIKASEMLFSLRQGPEAFERAAQTMLQDMKNQVNAQRGKLSETRSGILGLMDQTVGKPWLADEAPPVTPGSGGGGTAKRLSPTSIEVTEGGVTSVVNFPSAAEADKAWAETQGKTTTGFNKPPANPKKGDVWNSPTGPKKWDGTYWQ